MSTTLYSTVATPPIERASRPLFGLCTLALIATAALIAGWLPIAFSIVTVFLFAGPHNWVEARYFLSRLPARWGRLQGFFLVGFIGVVGLTAGFAGLSYLPDVFGEHWVSGLAGWNTLLALWIASLVHLRSRQNPRRDWLWIWPVTFFLIALTWLTPMLWSLGLVYLHPLIALWILDREIRRTRPEYRRLYHLCLLAVPICLGGLWWKLAGAPDLEGDDLLQRITHHAGAGLLEDVSSHLLVATHTFLEAVHYGVWLLAIPWLGARTNLWSVPRMPLGRRSLTWTRMLQVFLALSACIVIALWLCFYANYPITRDVYFMLAMVHVLAEAPFPPASAVMDDLTPLLVNPWTFLPIGYVLTILIETPILCVGLSREHTMWRRVQAGLWLTACTYPIVVLVLPTAIRDYAIYLAVAETFAPLAECVLFWIAFAPLKQPLRDMLAIVLANLASFGIGIGMQYAIGLIG